MFMNIYVGSKGLISTALDIERLNYVIKTSYVTLPFYTL